MEKVEAVLYYLYLISGSPTWMKAVKIGYYVGDIASLRARYCTCYGSDLEVIVFQVPNKAAAITAEKTIHTILKQMGLHITNEVFHREAQAVFIAMGGEMCQDRVDWRLTRTALEKQKQAEAKALKKAAESALLASEKHHEEQKLEEGLDMFIQEECEIKAGAMVNAGEFRERFVRGHKIKQKLLVHKTIQQKLLVHKMNKRGFVFKVVRQKDSGKAAKVYLGLGFRTCKVRPSISQGGVV